MESTQFKNAIECTFGDLIAQFEEGEEFAFYEYGPEVISRVGYSTNITPQIVKQAAKNKVDLIMTMQNLVHVRSHTFTEIFGVRALAEKIKELFSYLEIVELEEEHFE